MDLTLDVEDYKLNVRAAGVIIHNGKILEHRPLCTNRRKSLNWRRFSKYSKKRSWRRNWKESRNNRICSDNRKLFWNERCKISWDYVYT